MRPLPLPTRSFLFLFTASIFAWPALLFPLGAGAQNSYPASGDALIHGLTIGTGPGSSNYANTAIGSTALFSNTGGFSNSAFGSGALANNTNGYFNTAGGTSALYRNTTGIGNTAVGYASLNENTTGFDNTAHGAYALGSNTTGGYNTAIGLQAMNLNSTGGSNTALGFEALATNSSGYSNVAIGVAALAGGSASSNQIAIGDSSLFMNTTGRANTAIGSKALYSNSSGLDNLAAGYQCLYANTSGWLNVAVGYQALYANQTGISNIGVGSQSLYKNTTGTYNIAVGNYGLWFNTEGAYNVTTGPWSLYDNTTGNYNCAYGVQALEQSSTGSENTAIGAFTSSGPLNLTNSTAIGYIAQATSSNSVVLGNSSVTSIGGYANWTNFSDGRYKKNITQNVPGLTFINKLQPITYTLDIDGIEARLHAGQKSLNGPDGKAIPDPRQDALTKQAMQEKSQVVYTGFVAQDVYKTAQSIGYNFSGVDKPKDDQQSFYGLRYSDFVVPLVKAVQELSAQNDSLVAANAQLNARLTNIEQVLGITGTGANAGATTSATISSPNGATLSLSASRLSQNIPNPFNQSTLINYYVPPNSGAAIIQITDMFGQAVRSVAVSGTGNGQLTLQTGQLAAGTYTYSLFVDGQLIDAKKMVLAR